jgi:hypothetical protein
LPRQERSQPVVVDPPTTSQDTCSPDEQFRLVPTIIDFNEDDFIPEQEATLTVSNKLAMHRAKALCSLLENSYLIIFIIGKIPNLKLSFVAQFSL